MSAQPKDSAKSVDLPPTGPRNADPITGTPGSHPIETGVGALAAGAASGAAVGLVAGPVGAAIGAAVGAIAGGYAGKGVGELIDPTTEDKWLREYHAKADTGTFPSGTGSVEDYRPAYRHGTRLAAEQLDTGNTSRSYAEIEPEFQRRYEAEGGAVLPWEHARGAGQDAYDRALRYHRDRLAKK